MGKVSPTQFDCDKMELGDKVVVIPRSKLYKFIRKYFQKDKKKIKIRRNFGEDIFDEVYQEDCVLTYKRENLCVQNYKDTVQCAVYKDDKTFKPRTIVLKNLQVGLEGIALNFADTSICVPMNYIKQGIMKNDMLLANLDEEDRQKDCVKFKRYKGDYFKKYSIDNNIKDWNISYCSVCGKPVVLNFFENDIEVQNKCICGVNATESRNISYEDFADWFAIQKDPRVKKVLRDFWIGADK